MGASASGVGSLPTACWHHRYAGATIFAWNAQFCICKCDPHAVPGGCVPWQVRVAWPGSNWRAARQTRPARCLRTTAMANGREYPLDLYRNIGIMAHIDAGKVGFHLTE